MQSNVAVFKISGQNIGFTAMHGKYADTTGTIDHLLEVWYHEHVDCNMN